MHALIVGFILAVIAVGWYGLTLRRHVRWWKEKALTEEKLAQSERQTMHEIMEHRDQVIKELGLAKDAMDAKVEKVTEECEERLTDLRTRCEEYRRDTHKAEKAVQELEGKLQAAEYNNAHKLADAEKRIAAMYQRVPRFADPTQQNTLDKRRMAILATMSNEDPSWFVFMSLMDEHENNELEMGLKMGLSDGDRQYHAGRAASARDLASGIRDIRAQGQQLVAQKKAA